MRLEDDFRFNLQGQLSHDKTEIDVAIASKIAREFAVSFLKWVDSNYYQGDDDNCYYISIARLREGESFKIKELLIVYEDGL
jgi:hypothetical protein